MWRTRKERWVDIGDFGLRQRRISKSLVSRRAREYVEKNPRLKDVTALYRGIFSVQRKLSQRIPDRLPHIEGAQISYRLQEGRLLLEAEEMEIDLALLKEMMAEIIEVLRRKSKKGVGGLEDFLRGEKVDEVLRDMVDAFLERDEERLAAIMEDQAAEPSLLYLLLHVSLAPFYWKAAGSLARRADLDQVARGTCPVCGDLPVMGYLRPEDGLRVLECSRCGTRWGFPRMTCPFCMTSEQEKLRYIYAEEDPSRRVYLCDRCGKYIKIATSFPGKEEELVIPLEDLATAHLDLAAEEKGYRRGCRTIFA